MRRLKALNLVNQLVGLKVEYQNLGVFFRSRKQPVTAKINGKVIEIAFFQVRQRRGLSEFKRRFVSCQSTGEKNNNQDGYTSSRTSNHDGLLIFIATKILKLLFRLR